MLWITIAKIDPSGYIDGVFKKRKIIIEEMQKLHKLFKNGDVGYNIFMCHLAERIKSEQGYPAVSGTELHPFFESSLLLPQLIYLAEHAMNPQIKFNGLDTVILYSCHSAYLREFETGKLVVDCDSGEISSVGSNMNGGQITITKKTKLSEEIYNRHIGYEMSGGKLILEKDLKDVEIGHNMTNGDIIVNGDLSDYLEIGFGMDGGNITVNGNVNQGERSNYGTGAYMKGGTININGAFSGYKGLGEYMVGGRINVKKYADGDISVGYYMKGNSSINIGSDCKVERIGYDMESGEIRIGGNASGDLGCYMEKGLIDIKGNWNGAMLGFKKKGGNIYIRGTKITWLERFKHNM